MDPIIENFLGTGLPIEGKPAWLQDHIKASLQSCRDMALPDRRDESWKYTNPKKFLDQPYQVRDMSHSQVDRAFAEDYLASGDINIVLYNGRLVEGLSQLPEGLSISFLNQAQDNWEALPTPARPHNNVFEALNDACMGPGIFVDLEQDRQIQPLVHILFLYDSSDKLASLLAPKVWVRTGSSSSLVLRETHVARNGAFFSNGAVDLEIGANSQVSYYKMTKMNPESIFMNHTSVRQLRDSRFETFNLSLSGRLLRHELNVQLLEPGGHVQLDGVYIPRGQEHVDNQTVVDHASPHTSSSQLYKGALQDGSRGVFNGKVLIRKDSQHTNADQLNNNLLLSPNVEVDTKPQMEIEADDVKCSHGATVGQVDEEQLFYLRSRGIPPVLSQRLLVLGYLNDAVSRVSQAGVRTIFQNALEKDLF